MKKKLIIAITVLLLAGFTLLNSFLINPKQISVRQETLSGLPEAFEDKIIVYFSDIHYGFNDVDYLSKSRDLMDNYKPDIILFGGDLIEKDYITSQAEKTRLAEILSGMKASTGKYAVLGDEDDKDAREILEQGGFVILDNKHVSIYEGTSFFNIVGLTSTDIDVAAATSGVNPNNFTLGFFHYPDSFDYVNSKINYCIAAHSLGGQVFSFNHPVGAARYNRGLYSEGDVILDVSNGTGLTNKNVRFMADGEIVVYKLKAN